MRFYLKLTLAEEEKFYGPGIHKLLKFIMKTGSVKSAAFEMGLSYSKALKIIKHMEDVTGEKVVLSTQGGLSGGESHVTDFGKSYIKKYDEFLSESKVETERIFKEIFGGQDEI